jgi:hypothetical protein
MAFATVVDATQGGAQASNDTSHPLTLPTGRANGDLAIAVFAVDGNPTISNWPSGWTQAFLASQGVTTTLEVRYRILDGSESNFTLTTSATQQSAHQWLLVRGHHATTALAASVSAVGTDTTPNSASLNPADWDVEDTHWLTVFGHDGGDITATAAPTNYTNLVTRESAGPGGCGLAIARRELAAASDDPGTFTLSGSDDWVAVTIAIRPAAAAPPPAATGVPTLFAFAETYVGGSNGWGIQGFEGYSSTLTIGATPPVADPYGRVMGVSKHTLAPNASRCNMVYGPSDGIGFKPAGSNGLVPGAEFWIEHAILLGDDYIPQLDAGSPDWNSIWMQHVPGGWTPVDLFVRRSNSKVCIRISGGPTAGPTAVTTYEMFDYNTIKDVRWCRFRHHFKLARSGSGETGFWRTYALRVGFDDSFVQYANNSHANMVDGSSSMQFEPGNYRRKDKGGGVVTVWHTGIIRAAAEADLFVPQASGTWIGHGSGTTSSFFPFTGAKVADRMPSAPSTGYVSHVRFRRGPGTLSGQKRGLVTVYANTTGEPGAVLIRSREFFRDGLAAEEEITLPLSRPIELTSGDRPTVSWSQDQGLNHAKHFYTDNNGTSDFRSNNESFPSGSGGSSDPFGLDTALDTSRSLDMELGYMATTNAAPVAGAVAITPTSPSPTATVTATMTGFSDADLDTLVYHGQWQKNGVDVGSEVTTVGTTFELDLSTTGAVDGNIISITVFATDPSNAASGTVSDSETVTAADVAPAAPTGVVAIPGDTTVLLDWNDNTEPDLAGYNVYRDTDSDVPLVTPINGSLLLVSTYLDTGRTNGTTYWYVVEAQDDGGLKAQASAVSVTPTAAVVDVIPDVMHRNPMTVT